MERDVILKSSMNKRLFDCPKCNDEPDESFARYKKLNDWWIAYPEDNVIHIHYGVPSHSEKQGYVENKALEKFLIKTLESNPDKHFFLLADLESLDNSESISMKTMKLFIGILRRKEIGGMSVYGVLGGYKFFVKGLISMFPKVSMVDGYDQAVVKYERWLERDVD